MGSDPPPSDSADVGIVRAPPPFFEAFVTSPKVLGEFALWALRMVSRSELWRRWVNGAPEEGSGETVDLVWPSLGGEWLFRWSKLALIALNWSKVPSSTSLIASREWKRPGVKAKGLAEKVSSSSRASSCSAIAEGIGVSCGGEGC